jgi:hypothetical protein
MKWAEIAFVPDPEAVNTFSEAWLITAHGLIAAKLTRVRKRELGLA